MQTRRRKNDSGITRECDQFERKYLRKTEAISFAFVPAYSAPILLELANFIRRIKLKTSSRDIQGGRECGRLQQKTCNAIDTYREMRMKA